MKNKIGAKIVADSISQEGFRITTMVIKFPRYILAELNTHRVISKNSASSRAKPFKTMLQSVNDDPFIPVAWMKDHKGMQGNEFFDNMYSLASLEGDWLAARDAAMDAAIALSEQGLTKQIVNRILEPFLWHEVLVTATDWANFFGLRCPQYEIIESGYTEGSIQPYKTGYAKSRKDAIRDSVEDLNGLTDLEWREMNKGMADIHIMDLAEAMWDAYNESDPVELADNEWHLPYADNVDTDELLDLLYDESLITTDQYLDGKDYDVALPFLLKISAARCARISYKTFGEDSKIDLMADIRLHDNLLVSQPIHASPAEHQGKPMNEDEILDNYVVEMNGEEEMRRYGVSRNFTGFFQYRTFLNNETIR